MTPMAQIYDEVHFIIRTQGAYLIEIGAEAAGPLLGPEREACGKRPVFWVDDQMENA